MQVQASHILVPTLEQITQLAEQITAGADFNELARTHSTCPSGKNNGGDLGLFGRGQMVQPFERISFALPVGGISEPVETQFGFHLIKRTA
jgi:peptidyl-prolyl cis-trans isomerase C